MRALPLAVSLLCLSCSSVQDTCEAEDLDCWAKHFEADLDGDPLTPSSEFVVRDGVAPTPAGSSRATLWVVGTNGKIVSRAAGGAWSEQASGSTATLRAVWAAAANDVWAGGDAALLHFDGSAWSHVASGLARIDGISGTAPDDVWFAAASDGLVHFDGSGFSSAALGVTAPVRAVWSVARGDVWAGADDGSLFHGDGASWTRVSSGTSAPITGIAALTPTDVFFVAGTLSRGDASRGFSNVTVTPAATALTGVFAAAGVVWAVSQTHVVSGPHPDFTASPSMAQPTCAFFDGQTAFTPGTNGILELWERSGGGLGSDSLQALSNWKAITGLVSAPPSDSRVVLTIEPRLLDEADGGIPLTPGVRTPVPITFADPCGHRPGVCVQLCLRSARCASGVICRQPLADQRIKGSMTLYLQENARGVGAEPPLRVLAGPMQCANDGGIDGRSIPIRITDPAPPPGGSGGGTGGGGANGGGAGGGGAAMCAHCVEGQVCSGCGNIGRRCGTICCAPNETCMGNSYCAVSSTSGRSGPLQVVECGRDPSFTVQCGDGSCCGTCQTCSGDGRCLLP